MRRHQPCLYPWSLSAALHLGGVQLSCWLSSSLPVRQPSPTGESEESGDTALGVVDFGQELLLKFPPLLVTTSPLLFLPAFPAGYEGTGCEAEEGKD